MQPSQERDCHDYLRLTGICPQSWGWGRLPQHHVSRGRHLNKLRLGGESWGDWTFCNSHQCPMQASIFHSWDCPSHLCPRQCLSFPQVSPLQGWVLLFPRKRNPSLVMFPCHSVPTSVTALRSSFFLIDIFFLNISFPVRQWVFWSKRPCVTQFCISHTYHNSWNKTGVQ